MSHRLFTASLAATGVVFLVNAVLAVLMYSGPLGTMSVLVSTGEFLEVWTVHAQQLAVSGALESVGCVALLLVFVGLFAAFREEAPIFAMLGLAAGIATTVIDSLENTLTVLLAQNAALEHRHDLAAWLPLYSLATNLKWFWSGAALALFAAACPGRDTVERAFTVFALAFSATAILGLGIPIVAGLRGIFLLPALPLIAWLFVRYRRVAV